MTMYKNKKVLGTYTSKDPQWAWANIQGLGWRRIKSGAADGVCNLFVLFCSAFVNSRKVNVDIDKNNLITIAYLL